MSRQIALFLCIVFIFYLLRQDARRSTTVSYSLWIPWLWYAIFASRAVSSWFGYGVVADSSDYYLEGSPFDRNVFLILIAAGIIILWRRKPQWGNIFKNNKLILLYIVYLGLSTLWSDYTYVSFKRWIKELGNLTMVLIVLTEAEPVDAFKAMIKRCAYVLIPLSIALNRYFPELSRIYSKGGGNPMLAGVTTNKNALGALCMVCGVVLFWSLLTTWRNRRENGETEELITQSILLVMTAFVLYSAHSATSLLATAIGILIITVLNIRGVRSSLKLIKFYSIAAVIALMVLHLSFDITSLATASLGRDETLTGRTEFWKELLAQAANPLIGTGYESFWMGDRIAFFWEKYWWHPNQAHNGYLEIYLNLGLIGLTFLVGIILISFKNIINNIPIRNNYDYQVLRLVFLVSIIAMNITEANFKGLIWLVFLFVAMDPPRRSEPELTSEVTYL